MTIQAPLLDEWICFCPLLVDVSHFLVFGREAQETNGFPFFIMGGDRALD